MLGGIWKVEIDSFSLKKGGVFFIGVTLKVFKFLVRSIKGFFRCEVWLLIWLGFGLVSWNLSFGRECNSDFCYSFVFLVFVDYVVREMQPSSQHSRVNLAELKVQIVKRIGADRSKLYFYYLNRFLSLKLSKVEFNKLCVSVIGKDNVLLHNQFIRSILKNACNATVPPPLPSPDKEVPTSASDWSYSYPNGKADFSSHQSTITDDNIASEDGIQKLVQHHQEGEVSLQRPAKLSQIKQSTDGLVSVHSKEQSEITEISTPLQAPLGIPFCIVSAGCSRGPLTFASNDRCASSYDSGGLLDTQTLREQMQQIAAAHGLDGVSMDSANLLNSSLDAYLKRLIKSCTELINRRRGCDLTKNNSQENRSEGKLVNGFLPGHRFQVQSSNRILDGMQEQRSHFLISLLDLKVSMELNPQQLGEDWPLLLEKICTRPSEEWSPGEIMFGMWLVWWLVQRSRFVAVNSFLSLLN